MGGSRTRTISPAPAKTVGVGGAYPAELEAAERRLLGLRRAGAGAARGGAAAIDPHSVVGVGVSGGGIRSATFALGFFQALARAKLVRHIDYLSTVSGGGYFGGFLGRLVARKGIANVADAEAVLTGTHPTVGNRVIGTLRENGRYLSPNGSGDVMTGGAVLLRNWVSLQFVLVTAALAVFGVLQTLRLTALALAHPPLEAFALEPSAFWWSPWLWLPAIWFGARCLPLGWAYWFVESQVRWQIVSAVVVLGGAVASAIMRRHGGADRANLVVEAAVAASVVLAILTWMIAMRRAKASDPGGPVAAARSRARTAVSRSLATALEWVALGLVVGLIDSAGGTIVRDASARHASPFGAWWGAIGAAFMTLSGLGRKIVVLLGGGGGKGGSARPRVPASLVAGAIAAAVVGALLVAVDVVSHQIAAISITDASSVGIPAGPEASATTRTIHLDGPAATDRATLVVASDAPAVGRADRDARRVTGRDVVPSAVAMLVWLVLSYVIGRTWTFLNRSSHHSLYSARIGRAYLGASNPKRWDEGVAVTELLRDDDLPLADYFATDPSPHGEGAGVSKGGPLHLVNVTLNETTEGTSNVAQQDRHGTTLAVGPAGLSVGVADHAVLDWRRPSTPTAIAPSVERDRSLRAFGDGLDRASGPDVLPLSEWIGVSGAAFTTGLGAHTSVAMSLLAGIANVRLGHWWWSGVRRDDPAVARRQRGGWLRRTFGVQAYLFDELTARFPGSAHFRWYLSDGGFFENLGGYELLRRRHRRILLLDASADPTYTLDDLANLVRKARIDFGAEIRFLRTVELAARVAAEHRPAVGSLEDLAPGGKPGAPAPTEGLREPSRSHAALGQIRYADGTVGWLLYVKASVRGVEPVDVLRYQSANPAFPHEPTADQFFDEAQWESYRRLGEHVGEDLFGRGAPERPARGASSTAGATARWRPRDLFTGRLPAPVDPDPAPPATRRR